MNPHFSSNVTWGAIANDETARRIAVVGQMPQEAKAAFQWNTAWKLLPRLVDELCFSVAHSIACSNSGAEARSGGEAK